MKVERAHVEHEVRLRVTDAPDVDIPVRHQGDRGGTIRPYAVTVRAYRYLGRQGDVLDFSVSVEGRTVRRSDGELSWARRTAVWSFDSSGGSMPAWLLKVTERARELVQYAAGCDQ